MRDREVGGQPAHAEPVEAWAGLFRQPPDLAMPDV